MRILYCEWKKLLSFRVLWILLLCLLFVNGYTQISGTKERGYSAASYRALLAELSEMPLDEAEQFVQEQIDITFSGGASEYPAELLLEMQEDLGRLVSYPEYLANIEAQKNSMSLMSIWGGKDTFSYRNIQKTPPAYAELSGTALVLDTSLGIEDALQNPLTNFIGIFLLFLMISTVMLKDREQGMMPLLHSMPDGRGRLFFEKLVLIILSTLGIVLLLFGENFIISGVMYGFGDLSRPVQCIGSLYRCNLPISIGTYLVLFHLMKITAFLVFAAVFMLICAAAKNNLMVYGIAGGFCGVCYLLYCLIPEMSVFGVLHYLNPVQFVHVDEVLGTYCNINLFGYPFSLKATALVTMAILIAVTISISALLFSKSRNVQYRNISLQLFRSKAKRVHGQFYYVCYRSLVLQKGFVLVLAMLFAACFFSSSFSRVYTSDEIYYEKFTTQLQGVITQETHDFIAEKENFYAKLESQIMELQMAGASQFEISALYDEMQDRGAFIRLQNRVTAIQNCSADGELFYDTGYERLFGIDGNQDDMVIILFEMLFLAMLLSPYAAQDRKTDMVKILHATSAGKRGYWKHLLLYSAICGAVMSLLFNVPYIWHILQKYGTQGLSAPIQSITAFAGWNTNITVGGEIVLLLIMRTVSAAAAAMLMNPISSTSRSPVTAYVVNLSLFVLPIIFSILGLSIFSYIGMTPLLSYSRLFSLP